MAVLRHRVRAAAFACRAAAAPVGARGVDPATVDAVEVGIDQLAKLLAIDHQLLGRLLHREEEPKQVWYQRTIQCSLMVRPCRVCSFADSASGLCSAYFATISVL